MTHPEWKRRRCVHCAAGLKLSTGVGPEGIRRHFAADCPFWPLEPTYETCTAPTEAEYIAELETKCEALVASERSSIADWLEGREG